MRIDVIQCGRITSPAFPRKRLAISARAKEKASSPVMVSTVSFNGNNTVKGAGIGAIVGLAAMGAISALSGGLAAPIAYGVYAAAFGTAGGMAGKALDEVNKDRKKDNR